MDLTEEVLALVFIDQDPTDKQKNLIKKIVELTETKLMAMLPKGVVTTPKELGFIVIEVAIKRFNRIGSEGMTQEAIDGRTQVFNANDFEDFMGVINAWSEDYLRGSGGLKKLRFL